MTEKTPKKSTQKTTLNEEVVSEEEIQQSPAIKALQQQTTQQFRTERAAELYLKMDKAQDLLNGALTAVDSAQKQADKFKKEFEAAKSSYEAETGIDLNPEVKTLTLHELNVMSRETDERLQIESDEAFTIAADALTKAKKSGGRQVGNRLKSNLKRN